MINVDSFNLPIFTYGLARSATIGIKKEIKRNIYMNENLGFMQCKYDYTILESKFKSLIMLSYIRFVCWYALYYVYSSFKLPIGPKARFKQNNDAEPCCT